MIGGFAVIIYGFVRGTKDIDLLVDPSPENIEKIKKALSILPDNAISEMNNDEVNKYSIVRIADEFVIDLMAKACGIGYQEASQDMDFITFEGVKIPVPKKLLLIRMKNTLRPSDKMDVEFLRLSLDEEKKIK
ncbi:MAG: hypothetical protein HYS07_06645 [Chlamydiae bacterium]|nr:hypothetical protein [Chlamydiota bacterium]MBI3277835.1 hypothetical protein [Chlamydiota bacterium]